jgi:hypothetical protein
MLQLFGQLDSSVNPHNGMTLCIKVYIQEGKACATTLCLP